MKNVWVVRYYRVFISLYILQVLILKKIGMSQVFTDDGVLIPVTYLFCENNLVTQIKTLDKDGVDAVVLSSFKRKKATKNRNFYKTKQFNGNSNFSKGDLLSVDIFSEGEKVKLTGISKGKGFQGPVKRHNFSVARKTHGTKEPRHGSTGACTMPGRTKPGLKMAGRMGNDKVTIRDVEVVLVEKNINIIAVKGSVPGAINSFVTISKS